MKKRLIVMKRQGRFMIGEKKKLIVGIDNQLSLRLIF
jgi:hypothetical protein